MFLMTEFWMFSMFLMTSHVDGVETIDPKNKTHTQRSGIRIIWPPGPLKRLLALQLD